MRSGVVTGSDSRRKSETLLRPGGSNSLSDFANPSPNTMNRLRFAVISAALCFASAFADAQQPCGAKTQPTACFVDNALASLDACQRESPPGNVSLACIAEGEARIEPLYEKAIYASDRVGHTALLKDFHASWEAAMSGIRRQGSEPATAYKARQAADRNALEVKAERLKTE